MLIICPKCSAKYKIPDGVTLDDGQKLKCSACGFVFFKGEEAPLVLETPAKSESPIQPLSQEQPEPAFSKPLYTQSTQSKDDSLPEAFQPVATPKKAKTGSWALSLFYIAIVVALCIAGWLFRESLNPALDAVIPSEIRTPRPTASHTEKPTQLDRKVVPPVKVEPLPTDSKSAEVKPAEQPKTSEKSVTPPRQIILPEPEAPKPEVKQPEPTIEAVFVEPNAMPHPKFESKPNVRIPSTEPVKSDPTPTVTEQPTIPELPQEPLQPTLQPIEPAPDTQYNLPTIPDADWEDEESDASLFEVMGQPLPVGTEKELVVDRLTFRIEPNEVGQDQLLVEGRIQNQAPVTRAVPPLTVLILNKVGQVIADKKIHAGTDFLQPMQEILFFTGIDPAPVGTDHVEVHF